MQNNNNLTNQWNHRKLNIDQTTFNQAEINKRFIVVQKTPETKMCKRNYTYVVFLIYLKVTRL